MNKYEVGYIAVQKKQAITVFPDSIVVANKRINLCKPRNLGFSMDFVDYDWNDIAGTFVKEDLLGLYFSYSTKSDLTHTVDYLPKNQAGKLFTYAKEQLDILKKPVASSSISEGFLPVYVEIILEVSISFYLLKLFSNLKSSFFIIIFVI